MKLFRLNETDFIDTDKITFVGRVGNRYDGEYIVCADGLRFGLSKYSYDLLLEYLSLDIVDKTNEKKLCFNS